MDSILHGLEELSFILAPIFYKLLLMSLAAGMIGAVLIALRKFTDKKLSPPWKMVLWGLVLAALIIPYRPKCSFSFFPPDRRLEMQVVFSVPEDAGWASDQVYDRTGDGKAEKQGEAPGGIEAAEWGKSAKNSRLQALFFYRVVPLIWFGGALTGGLLWILGRICISQSIKRSTKTTDSRCARIFLECKELLGVKTDVRLITQNSLFSPALFGLIRPEIILPVYMEQMETEDLEYVYFHELSHLKRKDPFFNCLLIAVQIVYWFNPFIGVLCCCIREDLEILNDASVLNEIGADHKKTYARSLIRVLEHSQRSGFAPEILCMIDKKANLERRISMIKSVHDLKKHRIASAALALILLSTLSMFFLTQKKISVYEGKGFSLQYPKNWEAADGSLTPREQDEICRKAGFDMETLEELMSAYDVIFIDTEDRGEAGRSSLGVLVQYGKTWGIQDKADRRFLQQAVQLLFGSQFMEVQLLEEPGVRNFNGRDYGVCFIKMDKVRYLFQAKTTQNNVSYLFSYAFKADSSEKLEEEMGMFEKILDGVRITE